MIVDLELRPETMEQTPYEPPDWLEQEDHLLAPYAMRTRLSRGRLHEEPSHPFRTLYQRDRARIVHCTAFRRLMHKTQVLVTQTNDHHRTRLTHTLEVAQISRTIARRLGLNEDLTEAIALSHDLGHPPFGHAGEQALDDCMSAHGGFEHNLHGLRILDLLEYPYAEFSGLNLTFEVREAMAQHSKRRSDPGIADLIGAGEPLLEARVADAADSLAYDAHDVDDALGVGLISVDDLREVRLWQQVLDEVHQRHGKLGAEQLQPTVIRTLINLQVADLLATTMDRLRREGIETLDDVRRFQGDLVTPGAEVRELKAELEGFLHRLVYKHYRVQRMAAKGQRIVHELFAAFCENPRLLPDRYFQRIQSYPRERVVCDYVAGMTDRFAQDEYLRLFQPYTIV